MITTVCPVPGQREFIFVPVGVGVPYNLARTEVTLDPSESVDLAIADMLAVRLDKEELFFNPEQDCLSVLCFSPINNVIDLSRYYESHRFNILPRKLQQTALDRHQSSEVAGHLVSVRLPSSPCSEVVSHA